MLATGIVWGASIAFWRENEKLGGSVPWPRNRDEVREMTDNVSLFRDDH
ncbi:MAG TPA: hypothetical protein VJL83_03040 [Patescibacteria group bacterium]|nr:hypothetical protein [Patescibacteria group bacterium]